MGEVHDLDPGEGQRERRADEERGMSKAPSRNRLKEKEAKRRSDARRMAGAMLVDPPAQPKYSPADVTKDTPTLTEADRKTVARLVRKYGAAAMRREIDHPAALRARGRPPRGDLPYLEGMHLAEWIEEAVEEYRKKGEPKPVKKAIFDLFELTKSAEERRQPKTFERFESTLKRKLIESRADLKAFREASRKRDDYLRSQRDESRSRREADN
jgi:hypothetical protein